MFEKLFSGSTEKRTKKLEHLTLDTFKTKVFDFEKSKDWSFSGDKPAIIDFYADWCGPCKVIGPILEELAHEYDGKVDLYKINTEEQRELAGMFGIRSIPSILFIPVGGQPKMAAGAQPKNNLKKMISNILGVEEPAADGA